MGELGGAILERVLAEEDVPDDEAGTAEHEEGDEDENDCPQDREKPNGAFGVPDRDHGAIVQPMLGAATPVERSWAVLGSNQRP
jgi:hypothetical protein